MVCGVAGVVGGAVVEAGCVEVASTPASGVAIPLHPPPEPPPSPSGCAPPSSGPPTGCPARSGVARAGGHKGSPPAQLSTRPAHHSSGKGDRAAQEIEPNLRANMYVPSPGNATSKAGSTISSLLWPRRDGHRDRLTPSAAVLSARQRPPTA